MSLRPQQGRMREATNNRHGEAPISQHPPLQFRYGNGMHKAFKPVLLRPE